MNNETDINQQSSGKSTKFHFIFLEFHQQFKNLFSILSSTLSTDDELSAQVKRLRLRRVQKKVSFQVNTVDSMTYEDDYESGNQSAYSEYSDSDDVPATDKKGTKAWDYFYILEENFTEDLTEVRMIYKKETKLWGELYQSFYQDSNSRRIRFFETNYVSFENIASVSAC